MERQYNEMGKLPLDINRYRVEKPKMGRRDEFGEALEKWYGTKQVYGVYKKFGRARTARIFREMVKGGDKDWKHFMQLLHHD